MGSWASIQLKLAPPHCPRRSAKLGANSPTGFFRGKLSLYLYSYQDKSSTRGRREKVKRGQRAKQPNAVADFDLRASHERILLPVALASVSFEFLLVRVLCVHVNANGILYILRSCEVQRAASISSQTWRKPSVCLSSHSKIRSHIFLGRAASERDRLFSSSFNEGTHGLLPRSHHNRGGKREGGPL